VTPTRSYLSQCELTATFGIAKDAQIEKLEVRWPDGQVQTLTDVKLDQLLTVQRTP
ncbi:MAG: ASPIC/UnbV domain-containing protein, partial [bacterium]